MSYIHNITSYAKIGINTALALEEIYLIKTKNDLLLWHKKWTPWFHDEILERITDFEWKEKQELLEQDQKKENDIEEIKKENIKNNE